MIPPRLISDHAWVAARSESWYRVHVKRYEIISMDEAKKRRRALKLERRIERLEVLLAKRKAELRQHGEESMRLWWVSFVEGSGQSVDIVVRAKDRDEAFAVAARLTDDPYGMALSYELASDLYPRSDR